MRRIAFSLLGLIAMGCSSSPPPTCESSLGIDEFKELMIVDPAIVSDARTLNASKGTWSFRYAIESMTPAGMDPGEFVRSWFVNEWANPTSYNTYSLEADPTGADQQSRTQQMQTRILCPWYQRTASNGCDATCTTCTVMPPKIDLALAPFRLSAIINRMDLRTQPDIQGSGEARLEFGLTDGAGDNPASAQMPMALIFEYHVPPSLTVTQWAQKWHALGKHTAFDDSYKQELEALTQLWVAPNAAPAAQNGSAIGQVRTDESTLDWIWQLRQFVLGTDGLLHQTGVRNTPPAQLNGSQTIVDYLNANAQSILSENFAIPSTLLAGAANALIYTWNFSTTDPAVAQAFALNTCNGCHTQRPNLDSAFHISPFRTGADRLSKFLYDPTNRPADQLTARVGSLGTALCTGQ